MGTKRKTDWTAEELYELYIVQNLSLGEVGEMYGVGATAISQQLKKFGIKKSPEQKKARTDATNLKKYGVTNPFQSSEVKEKIRQTNLEKYGVENPLQCSEIKGRAQETNRQRYGVDNPLANQEVRKKMEATLQERYGVSNPMQSSVVRGRLSETAKSVDWTARNRKTNQTMMETRGVMWATQLPEVRAKVAATNIEKYGVACVFQSEEVKQRIAETNMERYGASTRAYGLMPDIAREVFEDRDKFVALVNSLEEKTTRAISQRLAVAPSTVVNYLHVHEMWDMIDDSASGGERELQGLLESWGIRCYKSQQIIAPKEIDLYCPDYHIGIEFNGEYWHQEKKVGKNYHKDKSDACAAQGVFLYHIFEHEWNDVELQAKIVSQLRHLFGKDEIKIGARSCEIRKVDKRERQAFLQANHLQGGDLSTVALGLYYRDELVALMTFCRPRFSKGYTWEMSRFCCKDNVSVMGGASKLFKWFTSHYLAAGDTVVSYSNQSKTRGSIYETLGFSLDHISPPNYIWTNSVNVKTRYQCQMKNEREVMEAQRYYRVYDCGNKVWVFQN